MPRGAAILAPSETGVPSSFSNMQASPEPTETSPQLAVPPPVSDQAVPKGQQKKARAARRPRKSRPASALDPTAATGPDGEGGAPASSHPDPAPVHTAPVGEVARPKFKPKKKRPPKTGTKLVTAQSQTDAAEQSTPTDADGHVTLTASGDAINDKQLKKRRPKKKKFRGPSPGVETDLSNSEGVPPTAEPAFVDDERALSKNWRTNRPIKGRGPPQKGLPSDNRKGSKPPKKQKPLEEVSISSSSEVPDSDDAALMDPPQPRRKRIKRKVYRRGGPLGESDGAEEASPPMGRNRKALRLQHAQFAEYLPLQEVEEGYDDLPRRRPVGPLSA